MLASPSLYAAHGRVRSSNQARVVTALMYVKLLNVPWMGGDRACRSIAVLIGHGVGCAAPTCDGMNALQLVCEFNTLIGKLSGMLAMPQWE